MPKKTIIFETEQYMKICKVRTILEKEELQNAEKQNRDPLNVSFTDAVKYLVDKGLKK